MEEGDECVFLLFSFSRGFFVLAVINFRETRGMKEKRPRDANATP